MKIVNLFPTKTCSIFVAITLLLIPSNDAKAVLVPTVNSDTLTNLIVSWTWDPENFNDVSQPVLVNWRVSLNIIPFPPNNQNSEDFSILLTARHITDPHPAINELGGGLTVTYLKTIDSDPFFGELFGTFPSSGEIKTVSHSPKHNDEYSFFFRRSSLPSSTEIRLIANHVSEPASIVLFSLGLLGMRLFRVI
ncbi:MAG TPA: hypothetical protein PKJ85_09000 [Nitrosomonas nitrosa]|uniref:hypothetical protein n=1 Tax=Nitrosomonas sp. TaxID=42353 RepID=UPI002086742B|nr:hypothetical protein [Nitrosomonas sp.]GJL76874.1 MAG: hypothetical protein NMNS02_29800 [Nitrosomonas sp.]HNP51918.1 hypothetical protein [Nitrosomonas nitrosa]